MPRMSTAEATVETLLRHGLDTVYALPGLSNVWLLIVKATSLLSLLQIADIVLWADRLGAPNFLPAVGLVHGDWRWRYYLVLFVFYMILKSREAFAAAIPSATCG